MSGQHLRLGENSQKKDGENSRRDGGSVGSLLLKSLGENHRPELELRLRDPPGKKRKDGTVRTAWSAPWLERNRNSLILDGLQRVPALSVPLSLVHDLNERLKLGAEDRRRKESVRCFDEFAAGR